MTETRRDAPDVIVFPPLIFVVAFVFGLALDWIVPLGGLAHILPAVRIAIGVVLFVLGLVLPIRARRALVDAGTNINPTQPALALTTGGVFARARNPMYLGVVFALLGFAVAVASDWIVLLLVPACFTLHYGVVLPEERYLERKFGDDYRRYRATVPRYGWRW